MISIAFKNIRFMETLFIGTFSSYTIWAVAGILVITIIFL